MFSRWILGCAGDRSNHDVLGTGQIHTLYIRNDNWAKYVQNSGWVWDKIWWPSKLFCHGLNLGGIVAFDTPWPRAYDDRHENVFTNSRRQRGGGFREARRRGVMGWGWVNGCHSTHNTYTVYTQYIVSPHLDRSGIFRSAILMHSWITGKSFRAASHTQDLLFRQRCVTIFSLVS